MTAGLNHGIRRGLITTFGLILGIWTQMLVVGVGLGALVAASTLAFLAIKWAGVAYLVYLGIQQWRVPAQPLAQAPERNGDTATTSRLIARGWMVNAVNPKGTVFLLAVLPQFLDLSAPLGPQYMVMALSLGFTDLVVMSGYTALAARVLGALRSEAHVRATNRVFGALFILAGAFLALFKREA